MAESLSTQILLTEVGLSGLRESGGMVREEFLRNLQGRQGAAVYKQMSMNDPVIGGLMHAIVQSIRKVPWMIEPQGGSQKMRAARELVATSFNDMSFTWQDTLGEILSFPVYGWAALEKVWKWRRGDSRDPSEHSRYTDGYLSWRKFGIRAQDTVDKWVFDDAGGIQGFWQLPPERFTGKQFLPINKLLHFRTIVQRNNPEGKSILRPAYRSWYYKTMTEDMMAIGIEKDIVGIPYAKTPPGFDAEDPSNSALISSVTRILRNISNNAQAALLLPAEWEFSLLASPGEKQFPLLDILQYHDKRIAISTLGQFILLGMERVGSFALARQQNDLFTLSLHGWISSIVEIINRFAVDELLEVNGFGNLKERPQLAPGKIVEPNLEELSSYIVRLVQAQAITPDPELEGLLRRIGGLTEIPERPSIVREARDQGIRQLSRQPASGTPIPFDVSAPQPFVVGNQDDGWILASFPTREGADAYYQESLVRYPDIRLFLGELDSHGNGYITQESIPMGKIVQDDRVFLDWCKAQSEVITKIGSNGTGEGVQ
jgi:hypothetical protein